MKKYLVLFTVLLFCGVCVESRSTDSFKENKITYIHFAENIVPCASGNDVWLTDEVPDRCFELVGDFACKSYKKVWCREYIANLHNEGGLIIWYSNTDALIQVFEFLQDGSWRELFLCPIEYEMDHRIIYTDKSVLGRVFIRVVSDRRESFDIGFVRYEYDPT